MAATASEKQKSSEGPFPFRRWHVLLGRQTSESLSFDEDIVDADATAGDGETHYYVPINPV